MEYFSGIMMRSDFNVFWSNVNLCGFSVYTSSNQSSIGSLGASNKIPKLQFTSLTLFWVGLLVTTVGYVRYSNAITHENIMLKDNIKELQILLIQRNYALSKFGTDGKYGPETIRAVKAFQRDYMTSITGKINSKFMMMLSNPNNVNKRPDLN